MSAHQHLREATRAAHDRVDAAFAHYDLRDPNGYRAFLTGHAAILPSIERALGRSGASRFVADWAEARRAPLLEADLADLGVAPPEPVAVHDFADDPALLGALYVIEGSRLGGAMLRRSVPAGLPARFLSAAHLQGRWRSIIATLDSSLRAEADVRDATASALRIFDLFERTATRSVA